MKKLTLIVVIALTIASCGNKKENTTKEESLCADPITIVASDLFRLTAEDSIKMRTEAEKLLADIAVFNGEKRNVYENGRVCYATTIQPAHNVLDNILKYRTSGIEDALSNAKAMHYRDKVLKGSIFDFQEIMYPSNQYCNAVNELKDKDSTDIAIAAAEVLKSLIIDIKENSEYKSAISYRNAIYNRQYLADQGATFNNIYNLHETDQELAKVSYDIIYFAYYYTNDYQWVDIAEKDIFNKNILHKQATYIERELKPYDDMIEKISLEINTLLSKGTSKDFEKIMAKAASYGK